jgi:uncharacterized protein (DUF1778 family)
MEDTMAGRTIRTTKLDLRLSPEAKRALTEAARVAHTTVSQFVLESALTRANETLLERRRFELDAPRWTAFMAALDSPPRDLPRLRRLFEEASPLDPPAPE